MNVQDVIAQAKDALTVKRVFGDPYEKDGVVLVPAKVTKTLDELECIRQAQAINERAMRTVRAAARPGALTTDLSGAFLRAGSARRHDCGKRINVDASGKIVTVPKQDGSPQRRVMIILVIRHGEAGVGFRIDTVVDVRAIDADQNNLSAPLHRDLCG